MKIGIVGTGNISSRHLDEFNNMPNVNVEAVCDTNQKNLEIFLSNNKGSDIRGYLSLEEMLEKVSEYLESRFESSTKIAMNMLEPMVVIFLGLFVALIVLAILLPLVQLNTLSSSL